MDRIVSIRANVPAFQLRTGQIKDWGRLGETLAEVGRLPINIVDKRQITTDDIRSVARRCAGEEGVDLIIVDYLELIRNERRSEEPESLRLGNITKDLRNMLQDLDCPLLLLHQLSRNSEKENRRPRLHDLRWSGDIEQDADGVYFLHHQARSRSSERSRLMEFIIAKQRQGPIGQLKLIFETEYLKFSSATRQNAGSGRRGKEAI